MNPVWGQVVRSGSCQLFRRLLSMKRIRNIGVVAHVDAGKTSTTERILQVTGVIKAAGSIHHGTTTTDYLECEQSRGITVTSAFVRAGWNGHTLHIIDTPGHLDFNFEVERSLRVLDGALLVLDGSKGVEAQTVTVWKQLNRYRLPRILFINKMDRESSSVERCLTSIREELSVEPILLNSPLIQRDARGRYQVTGVQETFSSTDMLELLLLGDPLFEEEFSRRGVDFAAIPRATVLESLERICQSSEGEFVLVCVGSAISGVGVPECLDYVTCFLPSPRQTFNRLPPNFQNSLTGVVFKSSLDSRGNILCQSRIYSGKLKLRQKLLNLRNKSFGLVREISSFEAGSIISLDSVEAGDICMISGCDDFRTGDVFVDQRLLQQVSKDVKDLSFREKYDNLISLTRDSDLLNCGGIVHKEPLFFCNLETESSAAVDRLKSALHRMTFEDPTLVLKEHEDGTIEVGGMGELHLSIVRDRLRSEHKVETRARKIRVNYLETISEPFSHSYSSSFGSVHLEFQGNPRLRENDVRVSVTDGVGIEAKEFIVSTILSSLSFGPMIGHRVIGSLIYVRLDTDTFLRQQKKKLPAETLKDLKRFLSTAVRETIKANKSNFVLAEPIAHLEVTGQVDFAPAVLSHYSSTIALPNFQLSYEGEREFRFEAECPLSKLLGYPSRLGKLTKGRAAVTRIEVGQYLPMEMAASQKLVQDIKLDLL